MSSVFVISDTHFGHLGVCKFLREDGTKLRPWDDPDEMDEEMIKRWNDTVRPNDKVYHLGDVVINRKALNVLYRLNGDKVLIKGNHDIFKLADYTPFFRDIRAYHVIDKMVLSHVPMHEESIERWTANIHGHLHYRRVLKNNKIDPRYHNVSVEHTDYRPILFEDVLERIKKEQGK